jgi:uncharacterized protein (DUF983 family)
MLLNGLNKRGIKMLFEKMKKIGIILTIAILFSVFCFSLTESIITKPEYSDFCKNEDYYVKSYTRDSENCSQFIGPNKDEIKNCSDINGRIAYSYDEYGCETEFRCETCSNEYDIARKNFEQWAFIICSIIGLVAVIVGLYIFSENTTIQSIYSGFMIGGIITIFFATIQYFSNMERFIKPIILFAEMALIIWVSLKTSNRIAKKNKKK